MKLSELLDVLYAAGLTSSPEIPAEDKEITACRADSRKIKPGEIYFCLGKTAEERERFSSEARASGAAAVLSEAPLPGTFVPVTDCRTAWAAASDAAAGFPSKRMKYLAVTGTNGKTSVSYLIGSILEAAGIPYGRIGTVNAPMTTPDPDYLYPLLASMADDGKEYAILEASSHALVQKRLSPLCFEVGVFLGLTREHLDFHRGMEEYYQAKKSLFSLCRRAVINTDDPYGERLYRELCEGSKAGKDRIICSFSPSGQKSADLRAEDVAVVPGGALGSLAYRAVFPNKKIDLTLKTPMPWSFAVCNTLAAAAVFLVLDPGLITPEQCAEGIAKLNGVPGRLEKVTGTEEAGFPEIYIDYAHTPDALAKSLSSLRSRMSSGRGRLFLLVGCGGDRDRSKRPLMGKIASERADFTVITSDNSRGEDPEEIIREIMAGFDPSAPHEVIPDRKTAIRTLIGRAEKEDILLLAGKGHEDYEIRADGKHPFSEKEIVAELARERMTENGNKKEEESEWMC